MKAKILIDDPGGRFKLGEVGALLENNYSDKYDYFIRLEGKIKFSSPIEIEAARDFYFYKEEVELLYS